LYVRIYYTSNAMDIAASPAVYSVGSGRPPNGQPMLSCSCWTYISLTSLTSQAPITFCQKKNPYFHSYFCAPCCVCGLVAHAGKLYCIQHVNQGRFIVKKTKLDLALQRNFCYKVGGGIHQGISLFLPFRPGPSWEYLTS
jgi:hypothetical protein